MNRNAFLLLGALAFGFPDDSAAAVTGFFSAGSNCGGPNSATFIPGGPGIQVSLCATTTSESICGSTIQLESASAAESSRFTISNRTLPGIYSDPNSLSVPYPLAITNPRQTTDLGGTVSSAAPPAPGPGQLLATFTLMPQGTATNGAYGIGLSSLSAVASHASDCFSAPVDLPLSATFNLVRSATIGPAPSFGVSALALHLGGQSMRTTSPAKALTVTNNTAGNLTIGAVSVPAPFAQTNNCTTLAAGASCSIQVTITPPVSAGPVNLEVVHGATLAISTSQAGNASIGVSGVGEKSFVSHYYRSILGRDPDPFGKSLWTGEAARVAGFANVNEVWFSMALAFFASEEYSSRQRDSAGFVTDLYKTFFNRGPDPGGQDYWMNQLASGLPRQVALLSFMFSPEFTTFTREIYGDTSVRAESSAVMDFYRGLLARLPDTDGYNFWLQRFRAAQCQGAAAVNEQVESISSFFVNSPEYLGRGRSNDLFVGDMYNAFLRRGGDLGGVLFWINQLDTGARDRENVRRQFIASPEFQSRVNAIISETCLQ